MTMSNLDNEIIAITEQYNTAIALLDTRKKALIEKDELRGEVDALISQDQHMEGCSSI